jgi:hypothetical protein
MLINETICNINNFIKEIFMVLSLKLIRKLFLILQYEKQTIRKRSTFCPLNRN